MKAWTDYPFVELGDVPFTEAPIREVEVLDYDEDKYVTVVVDGITTTVKAGYLYTSHGRYGDVPKVATAELTRARGTR